MINRIYFLALASMFVGLGFSFIKLALFGLFSFAITAFFDLAITIIKKFNKPPKNNGTYKF